MNMKSFRCSHRIIIICTAVVFYDYEDDFEDEEEAYDAAEDYWYDHH